MADSPDFVAVYLAAMRMGAIPVPVSTMLRAGRSCRVAASTRAPGCWPSPRVRASWPPRPWRPRRSCQWDTRGRRCAAGRGQRCQCTDLDAMLAAGGAGRDGVPRHRGLPGVLAVHLGHHRARAKAAMHRHGVDPGGLRDLRQRCSASGRTTAACRRRRRSSPTAWATRCCSRSRSGRRRCWSRPGPGPDVDRRARRRSTAPRCSSPARPSSPTCCAPSCPATRCAGVRLAASAGEALPAACTSGGPGTSGWTSSTASG